MTVAALPATASYVENGVTTAFAVPFRFKAAGDLVVERVAGGVATQLMLGVDYTVTGGATDAGGTVTRLAATNGATLRIRRRTARAQPMVYTAGDRFPAKSHEDALDRLTLISQEDAAAAADLAARGLFAGAGETIGDLPGAALRAGKAIGFGADPYQPLMISLGGADGALRSDIAQTTGGALIGYKPDLAAMPGSVKTRLDQLDFIPAAAFGVTAGVVADQGPAINAAYVRAAALGKNVMLPQGAIYVGSPITVLRKVGLAGHGYDQTRLTHMAAVTTPMFVLDVGAITLGFFRDFGCYMNGLAGEDCFGLVAQPETTGFPQGGLWYWTFDRIRIENVGGVGIKLWGGTDGKLPMQFLTIRDVVVFRAASATSRSLSLAGQCGQIFGVGNNQFDCIAADSPGCNIAIGSLYRTSNLAHTPGDAFSALNGAGGLNAGWENIPGAVLNNPYAIHLSGVTTQSGYYGVFLDNGEDIRISRAYFEDTVRAVTAFRTTGTVEAVFHNAGAAIVSDTFGYILGGGGANTNVVVADGSVMGGRTDALVRRLSGNPNLTFGPSVMMPGLDLTTLPSDVVQQGSPDGGGVMDLGTARHWIVGNATGVQNVSSLIGRHPPGARITIGCAFNSVIQFGNTSNPAHAGDAIVLRYGDVITVERRDAGAFYLVTGRSVAPLTAAVQPTTGYFAAGEFVRNTGAAAYTPASGKLLFGWARKTTGTAHVAGTDWEPVYATNS